MVIFPALFTCFAATSAKLLRTFIQSDFLTSVSADKASARPPLVRTLPLPFMAFMAFMAFIAFIAFIVFIGAIATRTGRGRDGSNCEAVEK